MRLRRDDVIDAAMALLDEVGLDELTTRRLAERLGVRVGALYWHVTDKRELLTALADRIVAEAYPEDAAWDDRDWSAAVVDGAHRLRAALLRHPDGARLVAAYAPVSPGSLRAAEAGLRAMVGAGLPLALAAYAGDAVMSYVTGFVLQEQSTPAGEAVELSGLPYLQKWVSERPAAKDPAFATGLEFIVAGIRATFG